MGLLSHYFLYIDSLLFIVCYTFYFCVFVLLSCSIYYICAAFLFYLLYLCCLNNQHLCHSARKYHLLQLYALNYQGYGLSNPGFDYWERQYFSLHQNARNDFGSTQPHTQSVAGFLPGDKAV